MNPEDFRNLTWLDIQSRLHGLRQIVYQKLIAAGPSTTRQLAQFAGLDLLTVRPRVTELCQIGLVEVVSRDGHDGVYEAVSIETARERFEIASRKTEEQSLLAV